MTALARHRRREMAKERRLVRGRERQQGREEAWRVLFILDSPRGGATID